jgi:RimJ/RimL family protein N-acetyltransferase
MTVVSLKEAFGTDQVGGAELYLGEGKTEAGTVLFAPILDEMIYIFWKDPPQQHSPRLLRINGRRSRWQTVQGITLGSNLQTLEHINGGPFTLTGFGWDQSGTVASWLGGVLETAFAPCRFVVRFLAEQQGPHPE